MDGVDRVNSLAANRESETANRKSQGGVMKKWSEMLDEQWQVWDVKRRADELQRTYHVWNAVGILMGVS